MEIINMNFIIIYLQLKNILSMPEIHIYDKNALENLKNIYEKIKE